MAEEGTLCVNGDAEKQSGLNGNSTADAEAYTNVYIKMAEGYVCTQARYDFVINYGSISDRGKEFLRILTSAMAGFLIIKYDGGGYTSLSEAQSMQNQNWAIVVEGINLLRDDNFRTFVIEGEE